MLSLHSLLSKTLNPHIIDYNVNEVGEQPPPPLGALYPTKKLTGNRLISGPSVSISFTYCGSNPDSPGWSIYFYPGLTA